MHYERIALAIAALALAATVLNASRQGGSAGWAREEREPFHYTFAKATTLDVDNISGAIQVIGDSGTTIRVDGERILRADDQSTFEHAKRDVTLDVNEKDGIAQLYVNGPFRGAGHSTSDHGFHDRLGGHEYEAVYDFTVHVPHDTALRLSTVNGEVTTEETRGQFDVRGVSGNVTMAVAAGSGTLRTVNGRASISFREPPRSPSEFKTVNGTIEATFPPDLSADIQIRTLNGKAWTDFEATAVLPRPAEAKQGAAGRVQFSANRTHTIRVGSGGPQLSFETVNGDIRIGKESR